MKSQNEWLATHSLSRCLLPGFVLQPTACHVSNTITSSSLQRAKKPGYHMTEAHPAKLIIITVLTNILLTCLFQLACSLYKYMK